MSISWCSCQARVLLPLIIWDKWEVHENSFLKTGLFFLKKMRMWQLVIATRFFLFQGSLFRWNMLVFLLFVPYVEPNGHLCINGNVSIGWWFPILYLVAIHLRLEPAFAGFQVCWYRLRKTLQQTPGTPKYKYERVSFTSRELMVWGLFQGSVGVFLDIDYFTWLLHEQKRKQRSAFTNHIHPWYPKANQILVDVWWNNLFVKIWNHPIETTWNNHIYEWLFRVPGPSVMSKWAARITIFPY